jgi:NAD+ kinase
MTDLPGLNSPVGIVTNVSKLNAADATRHVCATLDDAHVPWMLEQATAACSGASPDGLPLEDLLERIGGLIVIGGDGTILGVAPAAAAHDTPILGVNPGRSLGFLTDVRLSEFDQALARLRQGDFTVVERATLVCAIWLNAASAPRAVHTALNDVTFTHGAQARLIALDVYANDEFLTTFAADGLIISTATGSTAHSMSAGGPVLFPSTEAVIVTPVCPHTLSNRPVILPRGYAIDVRIGQPQREVHVAIDGQVAHRLEPGERIVVELGARKVRCLHTTQRSFCHVLREKLYWRGDLRADAGETD